MSESPKKKKSIRTRNCSVRFTQKVYDEICEGEGFDRAQEVLNFLEDLYKASKSPVVVAPTYERNISQNETQVAKKSTEASTKQPEAPKPTKEPVKWNMRQKESSIKKEAKIEPQPQLSLYDQYLAEITDTNDIGQLQLCFDEILRESKKIGVSKAGDLATIVSEKILKLSQQ